MYNHSMQSSNRYTLFLPNVSDTRLADRWPISSLHTPVSACCCIAPFVGLHTSAGAPGSPGTASGILLAPFVSPPAVVVVVAVVAVVAELAGLADVARGVPWPSDACGFAAAAVDSETADVGSEMHKAKAEYLVQPVRKTDRSVVADGGVATAVYCSCRTESWNALSGKTVED